MLNPMLFTMKGSIVTINDVEYTVRLNHMNDVFFLEKENENYIYFFDKKILLKDDEIKEKYLEIKDKWSS